MANESHKSKVFEIEKCQASVRGASDLVDCLAPEQAHLCDNSLSFGNIYFCKHPRQKEFIEITEKLRSKLYSLSDVSQSDNQE